MHADVFFFISAVGFVILFVLWALLAVYLMRATRAFHRLVRKAHRDADEIGGKAKDMLDDVKESSIFHLFFKHKKK